MSEPDRGGGTHLSTPTDRQSDNSLSAKLIALAKQLDTDAELVLEGAGEILDEIPGQQQALLLLVSALRVLRNPEGARSLLELIADRYPKLAAVQYELGLLFGRSGLHEPAIACLKRVVELEPNNAAAWRALGNLLSKRGNRGATAAYMRQTRLNLEELRLLEDAMAIGKENLVKAENMLRVSLEVNPTDVYMVRLLGKVYTSLGDYFLARKQFARAIELTPQSIVARDEYAESLQLGMLWRESIQQLDKLMEMDPHGSGAYKARKAISLVMVGDNEQAFRLIDEARPELVDNPTFWLNLGHSLRIVGRSSEAVEAYRKCLQVDPGFGAAWWGLANLKTYRFSPADVQTMESALRRDNLGEMSKVQLEFAIGQALEHEKKFAESFEHYSKANALRRRLVHHSADMLAGNVKKAKAFFTGPLFRERSGLGCAAPDPIFIVGMVRAGSTLIEQILSSHSQVEGTMELPDLGDILTELVFKWPDQTYPELLANLDGAALKALGEKYLQATRPRRILGRPFFTDKAGTNLWRVGLIHLILPNAKIIDARRHPLGCCFSAYKQDFPGASTAHSYDLSELGRYYRNYVEIMAHFDKVLPGRVHRVFHEDMILNPEHQIRRLLDFCGLPFEDSCLRFYETERSVRTFSSEQVRKPVSAATSEQWRHYEAWLGPLKEALGDVLTRYPDVPDFDAA